MAGLVAASLALVGAAPTAASSGTVPAFVRTWGTGGSGTGQFDNPNSIATDAAGNVYVVDRNNDRIQKFDPSGTFLLSWGAGHLTDPLKVAIDGAGKVYVLDSGQVMRFTATGMFIDSWTGTLTTAHDLAVDNAGNVYTLNTGTSGAGRKVRKYTSSGSFVTEWTVVLNSAAIGVRPDGTEVYTAESHFELGTFQGSVSRYGPTGTLLGEFANNIGIGAPLGLGVAADNTIYLSDAEGICASGPCNIRHSITAFNTNGTVRGNWGGKGSAKGQFLFPGDVAPGPSGMVYVADSGNNRIQQFGPPGTLSGTVTESGSGDPVEGAMIAVLRATGLSLAGGFVTDANGGYAGTLPSGSYFLYVIDPTGEHVTGFFGAPTAVTVTTGGTTDADPVIDPARGSIDGTITEQGTGTPLGGAWALILDANGLPAIGALANGSGQFTVPDVATGSHYVGYIDPTGGHAVRFHPNSPSVPDATPITVTAGAPTTADGSVPAQATTPTGAALTGTVTESATGTPLGGVAVIALHSADYHLARATVTDPSGAYSLSVAAGAYKLVFIDGSGAHDMEWHDNQPYFGLANAADVIAPAVTNAALDPRNGTISGTVTDATTLAPLSGVWVVVIGPNGLVAGAGFTAADGTYAVTGLPAGSYRVSFVDPNGGRAQEYWDDSPDYAGASPLSVTGGATTTADADLALP